MRAKVKKITIGPTVAQYALSISTGTKVSKIRNLANDLALALAAPASTIRIEAPIPGTSLIGIEIPNPTPNFVFEKEMAAQLESVINKYELPLILGKSVSGDHIIKDLTELPHCLVAGATGTGKSVGINSILIGLLMTKTPDQLKLILVDPKMVEMSPYNGIPHLLTPVITDMELVVNALQWSIEEMLRRYRMLKQMGVRKLSEYNKKIGFDAMPYIVIVIDEMADLMLSTGIDVESKIVRLAQMSRAVGIHLVLATQRPSVDVITGLIKANVPGRISFSVATSIDSRVIIDQPGSEALIGKGDLLFKSPELPKPLRIQGAYTDIKDIEKVIDFIKAQVDEEDITYFDEVTEPAEEETSKEDSKFERDELFEDALELVINAQKASASYLQRKLRIGYNRAARLIDELHEAGAVGPSEGSSPRKVTALSKSEIMNKISSDGEIEDDGSDNLDEYMDEYDKDIE
ncbi:MAG TPA: DNA translocase FtsK [bacterium]|nr:DNA translocase FtsK [bacterium]